MFQTGPHSHAVVSNDFDMVAAKPFGVPDLPPWVASVPEFHQVRAEDIITPGKAVGQASRLPVIQQALHDAAAIANAQAGVISSVADAVEPGSGEIVKSAAEGLTTADRLANSMMFNRAPPKTVQWSPF